MGFVVIFDFILFISPRKDLPKHGYKMKIFKLVIQIKFLNSGNHMKGLFLLELQTGCGEDFGMLIGVILICSTTELLLVALNRRDQVTFSTKSVEAISS